MKPNAYHGIYATLRCDLSCECCCRNESDAAQGLQLSYRQLRQSLEETQFCCTDYQVHKVFTGGEPTLWKDGEKRITDVMVYAAQLGYFPHLVTNGQAFQSADDTECFMEVYLSRTDIPIEITISADPWHKNVNHRGRCLPLDNLLDFRTQHNLDHAQLSVATEWTCSACSEHLPTEAFLSNYQGLADTMILFPIAPCGRGQHLAPIVPKLSPGNNSKASLGAFSEIMERRAHAKGWGDNPESFLQLPNETIMNECSVRNGNLCLYADGNYYTCSDGLGDPLFRICSIGEISQQVVATFFEMNPAFQLHRELGPIGFLRRFAQTPAEIREVMDAPFPFGISGRGGCAIHRRLIETGLFQRVNAAPADAAESASDSVQC